MSAAHSAAAVLALTDPAALDNMSLEEMQQKLQEHSLLPTQTASAAAASSGRGPGASQRPHGLVPPLRQVHPKRSGRGRHAPQPVHEYGIMQALGSDLGQGVSVGSPPNGSAGPSVPSSVRDEAPPDSAEDPPHANSTTVHNSAAPRHMQSDSQGPRRSPQRRRRQQQRPTRAAGAQVMHGILSHAQSKHHHTVRRPSALSESGIPAPPLAFASPGAASEGAPAGGPGVAATEGAFVSNKQFLAQLSDTLGVPLQGTRRHRAPAGASPAARAAAAAAGSPSIRHVACIYAAGAKELSPKMRRRLQHAELMGGGGELPPSGLRADRVKGSYGKLWGGDTASARARATEMTQLQWAADAARSAAQRSRMERLSQPSAAARSQAMRQRRAVAAREAKRLPRADSAQRAAVVVRAVSNHRRHTRAQALAEAEIPPPSPPFNSSPIPAYLRKAKAKGYVRKSSKQPAARTLDYSGTAQPSRKKAPEPGGKKQGGGLSRAPLPAAKKPAHPQHDMHGLMSPGFSAPSPSAKSTKRLSVPNTRPPAGAKLAATAPAPAPAPASSEYKPSWASGSPAPAPAPAPAQASSEYKPSWASGSPAPAAAPAPAPAAAPAPAQASSEYKPSWASGSPAPAPAPAPAQASSEYKPSWASGSPAPAPAPAKPAGDDAYSDWGSESGSVIESPAPAPTPAPAPVPGSSEYKPSWLKDGHSSAAAGVSPGVAASSTLPRAADVGARSVASDSSSEAPPQETAPLLDAGGRESKATNASTVEDSQEWF